MSRRYKKTHRGVTVHTTLASFMNTSGRLRTVYVVSKEGLEDYRCSASITHQEAAQNAVNFWMNKGKIPPNYAA